MKIYYNVQKSSKLFLHRKIHSLILKWKNHPSIEIIDYPIIDKTLLYKIHDKKYVDGIFSGTITNGFGGQDLKTALNDLYQVSSFIQASRESFTEKITGSPVSGFHHATYDFSGRYCIFNGLMMSAVLLKEEGLANKVGILDLDFHYGDGTDDIIDKLGINYITHWGFAKNWVPTGIQFLNSLKKSLESFKNCDIILYQAGMDMFISDPNGGLLTESELRMRDRMVFEFAIVNKIPLVWNFAGGYTSLEKLVELHSITIEESLRALEILKK